MPEQHVLDRLASIPFGPHVRRGKHERLTYWASDVNPIIESLTKALSDHRRIALAYEAQVEQQAQQIGALRAEQARLRAENEELRDSHLRMCEALGLQATKLAHLDAAARVEQLRAENERLKAAVAELTVADINAINRRLELGAPRDPAERKHIAGLMWKLVFLGEKIERLPEAPST